MDVLDYFDQATLAILHGQGCQPEQALRLARDLVDRRGKFVEGLGCRVKNPTPLGGDWLPSRITAAAIASLVEHPIPGTAGEGEG